VETLPTSLLGGRVGNASGPGLVWKPEGERRLREIDLSEVMWLGKGAQAPASRIAFMVLAIPSRLITRFML